MAENAESNASVNMSGVSILELASVIRSKNAGPYELTLDIIFKDRACFELAQRSGLFTPALFAELYDIDEEQVLGVYEFEPANAIKATLVRRLASGDVGETDVYGAQQHAPLLDIVFPPQS
jgi:hypothetical protein